MKRLLYFFIKNNTFPVYALTFFIFVLWAIAIFSFKRPEFYPFRFINGGYALFMLLLCIFYRQMNRLCAFTFYLVAVIAYFVVTPIIANMVCSTEFYLLCAVPAVFLLTADYKKPHWYYTVINIFIFVCLIFLICYRVTHMPPAKLFIAERRLFFMLTKYTACVISISISTYAGFNTRVLLHHLTHKSHFLEEELESMATHDVLTGLVNRRRTMKIFNACEERKAYEGVDFAICIFDIDNFKKINDTYGHDAGDFVLKAYSAAVRESYPEPTTVARWGGEEFLIIFPTITQSTVYELDRTRKRIAETPITYNGERITVTATFGISSSRQFSSASDVLTDADHMLLDGKDNGKNRLVVSEKF